jgi:hypothetical protein
MTALMVVDIRFFFSLLFFPLGLFSFSSLLFSPRSAFPLPSILHELYVPSGTA